MAEYIEREALLKEMLGFHNIPIYIGHVTDEDVMFETMVDFVKEQPTADVVPVVRCGNCGYYKDGLCLTLPCNPVVRRQPNDYCSYGRSGKND